MPATAASTARPSCSTRSTAFADGATVVLGVNVDDLGDHRPGQQAAAERGAVFPLVDAGFSKADVREASRRLGLRTWDKPAAACLASRVPYGTPVTLTVLDAVGRAEHALRSAGFPRIARPPLRRRGPGRAAARRPASRHRATATLWSPPCATAGYTYVTLDLEGLRSGNLNQALGDGGMSQSDLRPGEADVPGAPHPPADHRSPGAGVRRDAEHPARQGRRDCRVDDLRTGWRRRCRSSGRSSGCTISASVSTG